VIESGSDRREASVDIAAWLHGLGLEQYEPIFRDNDIDGDVLPSLTAEDLKDLGINSVGHRRRLFGAIAALNESGTQTAITPVDGAAAREGERRQLTVMFCDLVGSTALSSRLDPEDLSEVIAAYHRAVAAIVTGFDGFVCRYMGDGVLIYFGYPQAHEDDAERAVRAGLSAIDAVGHLDVKCARLQARVGIATGLVVVGDLIGEGAAQEQSVVGETPNLTARLQALAEPDTVVIAAGTRRLVGDLFEYRDLGAVEVKGIIGPVRAWQVLRPSAIASRFEALRGSALTRLVGRDEEIDLLLRRWTRAKAGDGQVVLVSGEPGLGKSRIAAELGERLHGEQHIRLRYFCSPYHHDSALFPFIEQLGRASGFGREDMPAVKLEKLEAVLARAAPPDEDLALLADLLSLPASEQHPLPNLSPPQKKERTLEALVRQLDGLARQQPVVMVFEDAHWIDPTSREVLDLTVERVRSLPVLLIITFRPEFQPPWTGQPQVTMLALNRLDRRDRTALVEQIACGKTLPDEIIDQIVDRTDGVPLFIEELTKSVLESGLLREESDRYVLDRALPPFAIPTSLHDSLVARLDRLASVRLVAQIGAAIGREFPYALLHAVSHLPEDELQAALARIVASELVFQRSTPPDAVYSFKHSLIQDAAYSTLLRSTRQELHSRIANALEERFPDTVASQPEILAHHFTQGGLVHPAIRYWRRAGEGALKRSSMVEAVTHLTRGVELISLLPAGRERDRAELRLQLALGTAMWAAKGQSAPETLRVFSRARDLLDESATLREQMAVLYGLWRVHFGRSEHLAGRAIAGECLALAARRRDVEASALANRLMGETQWAMGEFAQARSHLEQTLEYFAPDRDIANGLQLSHDHAVSALGWLGLTLWPLGYPEQSVAASAQAVVRARDIGHGMTIALALYHRALLGAAFESDPERATAHSDNAVRYCLEHGISHYEHWARFCQGIASVRNSGPQHRIEVMRGAMEAAADINAMLFRPLHLGHLAAAHASFGEPEVSLGLVNEAILRVEETQERLFEAELHRLRGELLAGMGNVRDAETALEEALRVARGQKARMWELRAAVSLAQLRRDQGRRAEAHDLLAPVYSWFTEGFDTPDLKEARSLLDGLS
jgi:class 3 adenylate cyclase/predicted ATPase